MTFDEVNEELEVRKQLAVGKADRSQSLVSKAIIVTFSSHSGKLL